MSQLDSAELLSLDRQHVWHPYGSIPAALEPLLITSASGVRLELADGTELIDAMSSWWAAIHGYRNSVLDAAAQSQLMNMSHVMFGGLTHEPAIRLAERLVQITPAGLEKVFFSDSGSVAVEVAAKMAMQYWVAAGRPGKHRLLTWRGGYHGDTVQPMSVCDPEGGMHSLWRQMLPEQVFADPPPAGFDTPLDEDYLSHWGDILSRRSEEIAAIIIEPVVQGAGGMTFHNPQYLTALRELADQHQVLLIFDEIATGFGRTGQLFAADHAGVRPDILCVGKAMTGGYLSMAATLCTAAVAEQIAAGDVSVLAHGPTFMANPLAAAISLASIDLLLSTSWQTRIAGIESGLRHGLGALADVAGVLDVRVLGAIGVVQLDRPVDMGLATRAAADCGVWIRPFRDLIYTMPPFITGDEDVATVTDGIGAAVRTCLR